MRPSPLFFNRVQYSFIQVYAVVVATVVATLAASAVLAGVDLVVIFAIAAAMLPLLVAVTSTAPWLCTLPPASYRREPFRRGEIATIMAAPAQQCGPAVAYPPPPSVRWPMWQLQWRGHR